jgi:hypothetical protein
MMAHRRSGPTGRRSRDAACRSVGRGAVVRCAVRSPSSSRRATPAARVVALAISLVTGLLLASCGGYAAASHRGGYGSKDAAGYGPSHPSVAEQAATLAATEGYRRYLLTSAERLTGALRALAGDAARGDLAAARRTELDAQVDFDALRGDLAPDSATTVQLDGEPWSLGASPFGGLHRIERDLWARPDLAGARRVATGLAALSVQTAYVFSRAVLTPAEMLAEAQAQLEWAVAVPIEGREELYSHHDLADVVAAVAAARTAFALSAPLGRLRSPDAVTACARRFASLDGGLRLDGAPSSRRDAAIGVASWRSMAGSIDAADACLGTLEGDVQGFGSGRLYA